MTKLLTKAWLWLIGLFRPRERPQVSLSFVEAEPDLLESLHVYVVGTRQHPWKGMMKCPCDCGDVIELNMSPPGPPLWQIKSLEGQVVTLHPSIWRTAGCRSHFWIKYGRIVWCGITQPSER